MEQDKKPRKMEELTTEWGDDNKAAQEVGPSKSKWSSYLVGIGFWLMLIGFVSFPWTLPWLIRSASETAVQRLGQVEQVSFVVGWSPMTQLQVDGKPILLHQANEVPLGAMVERRRNRVVEQLCIVGTERCWEVASR